MMNNEQEFIEVELVVDDIKLREEISNVANTMGITPDGVVSYAIQWYVGRDRETVTV